MDKINIKQLYEVLYKESRNEKDLDNIISKVADKLDVTNQQLISALIRLEIDASRFYCGYLDLMKES